MRVVAVLAAVLLLSGCTWVRQELSPIVPPPARPAPAKPTVETKPTRKPAPPAHVERPPVPAPVQSVTASPTTPPPPDYGARCRAMADNRANDAKQLGAAGADVAKLEQDVYRDCMAQSVKPTP